MKRATTPIQTCALALTACAMLTSCADKAEIVRPDQQNIGAALGESAKCTPETLKDPNGTDRFVVEWNDGDRATLEAEMSRGVALVKFTCDGIKVLRSCSVAGEYEYNPTSKKVRSLQIADAASASANLSSPTPGASFQAAMAQGRALNLAYVMIGSMMTTVQDVTREQITREACREATHFVYKTEVGAFAIAAGEKGKAMAAAEVLRYGGANAEMSSERQALSSDGDSEACQAAGAKDSAPPDECRAMMRISIVPLVEGKLEATAVAGAEPKENAAPAKSASVDTRTCPAGLVFDGDLCVKPAQAETFLCKKGDLAGCETQCKKGSHASCGRMAEAFFAKHQLYSAYVSSDFNNGQKTLDALKAAGGLSAAMTTACDEELESAACTFAALVIGAKSGETTHPDDKAQANAMIALMSTGCEWGNGFACGFIVDAYGQASFEQYGVGADGEQLEQIVGEGCDSGSASACMQLGEFFFEGTMLAMGDTEVAADYPKAAKYVSKACYGGVGDACLWSAMMYGANNVNSCVALFDKHVQAGDEEVEGYLSLVWPSLTGEPRAASIKKFCQNTSTVYNAQKAYDLADKACYMSGDGLIKQTCALSASLKP